LKIKRDSTRVIRYILILIAVFLKLKFKMQKIPKCINNAVNISRHFEIKKPY
jgi:hypothetical protein